MVDNNKDATNPSTTPVQPVPKPTNVGAKSKEVVILQHSETSGPLPHPDLLRQYDQVVPGAAERIIRSFEKQGEHRQSMERDNLDANIKKSFWGLAAGWTLAVLFLAGGVVCILTGHDWAGGILATADIATVVSIFVYGEKARRSELSQKATSISHVLAQSPLKREGNSNSKD